MRVDLYHHGDRNVLDLLSTIDQKLDRLFKLEVKQMALGEDVLAKIEEANAGVDSLIVLLNELVANGTITPAVKAAIFKAISDQKAEVDAALVANTPPPPPTP